MILIDVEIPVMGQTYDFQVDESVAIRDLARELCDTICLHRQCGTVGDPHSLSLWDAQRMVRLPDEQTVRACGVRAGAHLILV